MRRIWIAFCVVLVTWDCAHEAWCSAASKEDPLQVLVGEMHFDSGKGGFLFRSDDGKEFRIVNVADLNVPLANYMQTDQNKDVKSLIAFRPDQISMNSDGQNLCTISYVFPVKLATEPKPGTVVTDRLQRQLESVESKKPVPVKITFLYELDIQKVRELDSSGNQEETKRRILSELQDFSTVMQRALNQTLSQQGQGNNNLKSLWLSNALMGELPKGTILNLATQHVVGNIDLANDRSSPALNQ
jgi:hypothetical protein